MAIKALQEPKKCFSYLAQVKVLLKKFCFYVLSEVIRKLKKRNFKHCLGNLNKTIFK